MEDLVQLELDHIKTCIRDMKDDLREINRKTIPDLERKIDKIFTIGGVAGVILSVIIMPIVTVLLSHYLK